MHTWDGDSRPTDDDNAQVPADSWIAGTPWPTCSPRPACYVFYMFSLVYMTRSLCSLWSTCHVLSSRHALLYMDFMLSLEYMLVLCTAFMFSLDCMCWTTWTSSLQVKIQFYARKYRDRARQYKGYKGWNTKDSLCVSVNRRATGECDA